MQLSTPGQLKLIFFLRKVLGMQVKKQIQLGLRYDSIGIICLAKWVFFIYLSFYLFKQFTYSGSAIFTDAHTVGI